MGKRIVSILMCCCVVPLFLSDAGIAGVPAATETQVVSGTVYLDGQSDHSGTMVSLSATIVPSLGIWGIVSILGLMTLSMRRLRRGKTVLLLLVTVVSGYGGLVSGDLVVVTGPDGGYALTNPGGVPFIPRTYTIHYEHPGYHARQVQFSLPSDAGNTWALADITMYSSEFSVSGTVIGLRSGLTLTLQLNGQNGLTLTQWGSFSFPEDVPDGTTYDISVTSSPVGYTTTVLNGHGTISGYDVSDVIVLVQNTSLPAPDCMVLVQDSLFPQIAGSIARYINDIDGASFHYRVDTWTGGTVQQLRDFIVSRRNQYQIKGVFLIGDFPAAWYEMVTYGGAYGEEQWPCDFYLMDLDGIWTDTDGDGIYNSHSALGLDIFVSRLIGTATEIKAYFDKNHTYRTVGSLVDRSAYIFKDDDWRTYYADYDFNLSTVYATVDICQELAETNRAHYIGKLTGNGAEYVYQWIHSYPSALVIANGSQSEYVTISDIVANNVKGSFYNLFDCSASRFTEANLAATYVMKTGYGLATHGSTKIGGNYWPIIFHDVLAGGGTWGKAFQEWYQGFGVSDDSWFLGMCILGDPLLTISEQTAAILSPADVSPPSEARVKELEAIMRERADLYRMGTYAEYKAMHPQFFHPNP